MKVVVEKRVGINRAEETRAEIRRRLSLFLSSLPSSSSQAGKKEGGGGGEPREKYMHSSFAVAARKVGGHKLEENNMVVDALRRIVAPSCTFFFSFIPLPSS